MTPQEQTDQAQTEREGRIFATTCWTAVLAAGHEDCAQKSAALEHLCGQYWFPVYAFIRGKGAGPHDAEDLTQGFFVRLLDKNALARADRHRGKFRTFLVASLINYLANEWDRAGAVKRGGGSITLSLQDFNTEGGCLELQSPSVPPDRLFDVKWAQMMVERALEKLSGEVRRFRQRECFQDSRGWIDGKGDSPIGSSVGGRIGPECGRRACCASPAAPAIWRSAARRGGANSDRSGGC